ncbi:MAG: signal peptidase I [Acutalibacteraceae bacterium]
MKKAENIISIVLIVIISILLAAVLILKLFFHAEFKVVMTGSMEPELHVGSLLIIIPADYDDIAVGDDITFVRDESLTLVTHRVVDKNTVKQTFTTQGIANNTRDAPVSYDNVLGKVRASIPLVGYVGIWLSTPTGIIIVMTVVIALIILILLIKVIFFPKKSEETAQSSEDNQSKEKDE